MALTGEIVFPVDFSKQCAGIATAVAAWARRLDAGVVLLHAVEFPRYEAIAAESWPIESEAAAFRERAGYELGRFMTAEFAQCRARRVHVDGRAGEVIVNYAREHHAGLIMMPTHGYGRFRQLLLGSVTAGVLHDAECPVWTSAHAAEAIVPTECRSLVCAIDFGEETSRVLRWAKMVSEAFGARLRVVHSVPAIGDSLHSGPADRAHEYLVQIARDEYPKLAAEAGIQAELELLDEPGLIPAVEAAIQRYQADLLVIGRGRIQGFLGRLRSNAHNLIRSVPCPVLSV